MKEKAQGKSVYTEEKKSKKSQNKRFTKEIKNPMGTSMGTSFDFSSMMDEQPKKAKKANASRAAKTALANRRGVFFEAHVPEKYGFFILL